MKNIIIDTSALIAVIVDEPERNKIIELTTGSALLGPSSIPFEIGNAFSAMLKRERISFEDAKRGFEIFNSIPLQYIHPDFVNAMSISKETRMYAYDAYFIDCALRYKAPLLTLDKRLKNVATNLNIAILEV